MSDPVTLLLAPGSSCLLFLVSLPAACSLQADALRDWRRHNIARSRWLLSHLVKCGVVRPGRLGTPAPNVEQERESGEHVDESAAQSVWDLAFGLRGHRLSHRPSAAQPSAHCLQYSSLRCKKAVNSKQ